MTFLEKSQKLREREREYRKIGSPNFLDKIDE